MLVLRVRGRPPVSPPTVDDRTVDTAGQNPATGAECVFNVARNRAITVEHTTSTGKHCVSSFFVRIPRQVTPATTSGSRTSLDRMARRRIHNTRVKILNRSGDRDGPVICFVF